MNKLLLVDDEPNILKALKRLFTQEDYYILTASNAKEALLMLKKELIPVIISDQRMPDITGTEFLQEVKKLYPYTKRIVLSSYTDFETLKDAINAGAIYKFVNKPWDEQYLLAIVREAFETYHQENMNLHGKKLLEESLEAIMIVDENSIVKHINPLFMTLTGFDEQDVIGTNFKLLTNDSQNPTVDVIYESLAQDGHWSGEAIGLKKNGDTFVMQLSIVKDEKAREAYLTYLFIDISEQKNNEKKIMELLYVDRLTGLQNRFVFIKNLHEYIKISGDDLTKMYVGYINIDRFRMINDSIGRRTGDEVLQYVANLLRSVIAQEQNIARSSDDAFIVLLTEKDYGHSIDDFLEALIKKIKEPVKIQGSTLYLSASIGVSTCTHGENAIEQVMQQAHLALQESRKLGGDNYQKFDEKLAKPMETQLNLVTQLHHALDNHEFKIFYQPIICPVDHKIISIEALLRWQHPTIGLIPPIKFLPLCESTGLIIPLGEWILRTACEQLTAWHKLGFQDLSVAINLSPRQFNHVGLLDLIINAIADFNINPAHLEIEITEGLLMQNMEQNSQLLKHLRGLGIQLALDDFGTGYSSLSYLKNLPFNILKIDKSFIDDIDISSDGENIIRTIVALGKSLHMTLIAEGVEKQEQLDFLKEAECDLIQGYFYSKPVPPLELTQLLFKYAAKDSSQEK